MAENESVDRYCDKTLLQLKEILRRRKLKVTGKKKELVERLRFDDINSIRVEPAPEFHMTLPEAQTYIDLHGDHLQNFPTFTKRRLLDFFSSCDKSYDDKIEMLYEQRYVRFMRHSKDKDLTFVTAVIWAEMKKSTCYKVDGCIDSNGVVKETQCECAVGQGPSAHCKHVGCVLFALTRYCSSGCLLTEVTCTQVLQKFHKPRPHKGSPLKARNLSTARGNVNSILYDPRPVKRRDPVKIEETLRNTVLNWQGKSKWPVVQKYPRANVQALAADHDYLELTWEDNFLKQEKLSEISPQQALDIELQTRGQQSSSLWAQERSKRITASNFGVVCKATERRDIDQLLKTLTGSSTVCSKAIVHGKKYESVAVEQFEKTIGATTTECGLFVSLTHPMLAASPDRILDENTLVEVKCPHVSCNQAITEQTVPYLETVNGSLTLKKTHVYYYQVQGQMFCANKQVCKFIVYTFKDLKTINIPLDQDFVTDMLAKLMQFYDLHFKPAVIKKFMYKR